MLTVGVTAVGGGVAQAVLDSLRESGRALRIVGFDAGAWAKGAFECDAVHRLPPAADPSYADAVLALAGEARLDLLIPGSDPELEKLAEIAPALARMRCATVVGSPESVRICGDKLALARYLEARGAPFVATWPLEVARTLGELRYPLISKPARGSGSQGVHVILDASELAGHEGGDDRIVQPYLFPEGRGARRDATAEHLAWLARTRMPLQKEELSIQVILSASGTFLGRFASLNVLKSGVVVRVEPIDDEDAWKASDEVIAALAPLGLRGPINLQGRRTRDGVRFFEVNARFTGITHARALMGFDGVEASVRSFALGEPDAVAAGSLRGRTDQVALRQMTEVVVPRARVARLEGEGALAHRLPLGRVLVTGATGYLGYALVRTLLERGAAREIVAPVRDPGRALELWVGGGHAPDARISFVPWERAGAVSELASVDLVVHTAASRPPAATEPGSSAFNIKGTLAIVNAARRAATPRLIYVSSQAVYGTAGPIPYIEESPHRPEDEYGHSKVAAEALVETLRPGPTRFAILRFARLYGFSKRMRWEELPHKFARLAALGSPLPVVGGGRQGIDLLHIRDAVESVLKLIEGPPGAWDRTYNIGRGAAVAVIDLAEACLAVARARGVPGASICHVAAPAAPPRLFGMDTSRARRDLGWAPRVDLGEAIAELIGSGLGDARARSGAGEAVDAQQGMVASPPAAVGGVP